MKLDNNQTYPEEETQPMAKLTRRSVPNQSQRLKDRLTTPTKGKAEPVMSKEQKQVKILVEEATPDGKVLSLEERTEIVLTDREKEWMARYKTTGTKE